MPQQANYHPLSAFVDLAVLLRWPTSLCLRGDIEVTDEAWASVPMQTSGIGNHRCVCKFLCRQAAS